MIDEKKLIEDIEYYISHTSEQSGGHYAYKKCKELLERQPKVGEWIPVEERLPKIGEQVMVCNRYGSVFVSAITYMNAKVFSTGECHDFGKHYGVVAWQPLPAPYDMRKKVEE